MIKKILIGFGILLVILIVWAAYFFFYGTRQHSPRETVKYNNDGKEIEIIYSRPSVKNRVIFGSEEEDALQPFGKYWRLGANQATIITLGQDTWLNGKELKKGVYSMYAVPNKSEWEIGFNTDAERWGATEPDYDNEVLRINVPASGDNEIQEMFLITFEDQNDSSVMILRWEKFEVEIPVSFTP